jgi:hypothetical protein
MGKWNGKPVVHDSTLSSNKDNNSNKRQDHEFAEELSDGGERNEFIKKQIKK